MRETPHLDAERLAALMDGTLSRAERAAAERHAADCGQCLELLAAMTRTEPAPVREGWRLPAIAKWAVPLAAAATALALWVNVDQRRPAPAPAPVERKAVATPSGSVDTVTPRPLTAPPPSPDTGADAPGASLRRDAAKETPKLESGTQAVSQERARGATANEEATRRERPLAETIGTPAATPSAAAPAPPPAAGARTVGGTSAIPPVPPPPPAAAERLLPQVASDDRAAVATARPADGQVGELEFASPDSLVRWRVRGNTVFRSTDGGKTWPNGVVAFHARVTAGASPSPQVAWVVGGQGLVMRTIDGVSWARMESPAPMDLVGVRARSALEADVTAVDGRVFRTTDGGRTWAAQEIPLPAF